MKQILYVLSIISLAVLLHSCAFNAIKGNGTIVSNEINISDYQDISFSGGSTIVYEQKTDVAPYLRIEIDENLYPILDIESSNGKLELGTKQNIKATKYNIYTNSKSLTSLRISGSSKVHLKGNLETPNLEISVSGSGNITIDSINTHTLKTKVSGSGKFFVTGKASILDSSISGSGKVEAINLITDTVDCSVSGSGNFHITANKLLKVRISGSGKVTYKGDPQIEQSISGSGKVTKEN